MRSRLAHVVAMFASAAGASACTDRPAPPEPVPVPAVVEPPSALQAKTNDLTPWAALAIAIDDARSRLLSSLGTGAVDGPLGVAFAGLATGIEQADAAALGPLLGAAEQALDRYTRAAAAAQAPELGALRLVLDATAAVVATDRESSKPNP